MFGKMDELIGEMLQGFEAQQKALLDQMTPQEKAKYNVFEQKRKKILQLPIDQQKDALIELSQEYGVKCS